MRYNLSEKDYKITLYILAYMDLGSSSYSAQFLRRTVNKPLQ